MLNRVIDFSIFSILFINTIVLFQNPFEFYLTYIPLILLLIIFLFKYKFPKKILYLFGPLLIFGVINVYFENNTMAGFLKIYLNVFVGVLFFYYVFEYYDRDVKKFFNMYMKWAVIASIIGIVQLVSYWVGFKFGYDFKYFGFNKWSLVRGGLGIRVNSIFCEPAYVGSALGPAFFISVYNLLFNKTFFITRKECIIVAITYFLSFSTVAYLGVFFVLILFLLNFGIIRYIFLIIPISITLFFYLYTNVNEFRVRMDGLKALYIDDIIEKEGIKNTDGGAKLLSDKKVYLLKTIHGSSFIQYNNYIVTKENFMANPLFGTGLGSHQYIFSKYDQSSKIGNEYNTNTTDANSMLLRIISETGLFGIIFIYLFIKTNFIKMRSNRSNDDYHWLISNAILILILLQLARQGNYTFGGFMAYMWLYYYTKLDYQKLLEKEEEQEAFTEVQEKLPNQLGNNTQPQLN